MALRTVNDRNVGDSGHASEWRQSTS